MKELTVDSASCGQRFDKFLKKYFAGATSSFLYKMLRKKNIVLNGAKANGSEILQDGDSIRVFFSEDTFEKMRGVKQSHILFSVFKNENPDPVSILYEDTDIIAADKPAGLCSMPDENKTSNANDKLIAYLIQKGEVTEESYSLFHPSVANRLDRNTSGIILFGKTLHGSQFLSEEIKERRLKKYYICVVHGEFLKEGIFHAFWAKDTVKNKATVKMQQFAGSKKITTEVFIIKSSSDYSVLKILLHTGRSHQIRAHLNALGHPLLFDPKYKDAAKDKSISNKYNIKSDHQLLHSARVELSDGRVIESPLPSIFNKFI
ncbi:MAG: RluA family pseudouridine synthase [Lachnospiraceae bacterium]|nr:RluA family pseudouridine synthase [Lachnospiraceae bacterium]